MATTTFSTILQRGSWRYSDNTWFDNGVLYNINNSEAWVVWDVADLIGQLSTDVLTADFTYNSNGTGVIQIDVMTLNRPLLAALSQTNPPTGSYASVNLSQFTTVSSPTDLTVELPLRTSTGAATPFLSALKRTEATETVQRFALGIRITPTTPGITALSAAFNTTATLVLETEAPEFTGIEGHHWAYGRADECPKCGSKSTRDTWTRDGYTDMMVCRRCYDEEDLVGRHYQGLGSEKPGQGEG